jgi:16S rRNA G966 N2-methylase RsmD
VTLFVSTSFHPEKKQIEEAKQLAAELNVPYLERRRDSLAALFRRAGDDRVVLVTKEDWRVHDADGNEFFFHPGMSVMRIKNWQRGQEEPLLSIAGLRPGDEVLDCTLGMGADAIVASYFTGKNGRVVALESQPVLAAIVRHGLETYEHEQPELTEAMRRIEVIQADYRHFLRTLPDRSFDIVMFDPMFRQTILESTAMQMLRPLANSEPLDEASVREAVRVARRVVLFKERPESGEFERLGFTKARESSQFTWGVIRVEERKA